MINQKLNDIVTREKAKLNNELVLIASENYPSQDILDLMGSVCSVPYTEGYPKDVSAQGRHYAGCEIIDELEDYCIEKAKELFRVNFANVQPMSGSHANTCVYYAFCKPGDRTLSASLSTMAHLTHGSKFTHSGRFYENHNYELVNEMLDYDEIKKRLYEVKPRLLITGYSAYSHKIDFQKIREIVDQYNTDLEIDTVFPEDMTVEEAQKAYEAKKCILWTDMAHFSGFIAAHLWEDKYDPTQWADVVTTTTHKTLRGPRSAIILWNNPEYCKKINQAVFPANGGGCNQAATAAKTQAFIEAATPEFKHYMEQVHTNMQALIEGIKEVDIEKKLRFVSGDITENHMILVDVKGAGLLGKEAEDMLTRYHIICNKNMISGDTKPSECTGIRLGTAAITTRGFTQEMSFTLGKVIATILLKQGDPQEITAVIVSLLNEIGAFYK
jgi:glycine hydroxymethyltransferase